MRLHHDYFIKGFLSKLASILPDISTEEIEKRFPSISSEEIEKKVPTNPGNK